MQVTAGIVPHAFTWRHAMSNYRCCAVVLLLLLFDVVVVVVVVLL